MKSVTVETALLADAVIKAARIAPSKGVAFDKAQGIVIEVVPDNAYPVRVMATDLDVSFYQRLVALEVGDEPVTWRTPASLISGWLSNLPMTAGKQVVLTEEDGRLQLKAGRSKARFSLISPEWYPKITPFDPSGLVEVPYFARRISQVAWAVARDRPPLTGIHIDGESLIACDRVRVAFMPCPVPIDKPVTAPLTALTSVLRNVEDVRLRATDRRLEMMPDDDTQLTAIVYQEQYPAVRQVLPPVDSLDFELTVPREQLLEVLDRMIVLVKGERYSQLKLTISSEAIDLDMRVTEKGDVQERLEVVGGPVEPKEIWFDPLNLRSVAASGMREQMTIGFGSERHPAHFYDASGFDAWLMPVLPTGSSERAA